MTTSIESQRNALLQEIRELPAEKALVKLHQLRREYDWAIPGYRNSLNILSDTTYQDRKHFLLELIQNADDATYSNKIPEISFIIENTGITIHYNEDGFSVEDVIAITDTGESTKIQASRLSHRFIGEKGIGFKSVFALASSVEIGSPPWHFILKKEECIIPYPMNGTSIREGEGTRLKIVFEKPESIDLTAKELIRIVEGDVESFLFLHQLSRMVVEDRREEPPVIRTITVEPADRSGDHLEIISSQNETTRKYYLYSKDVEFPGELVRQRWEKLGFTEKSLKRNVIVAFPLAHEQESLPEGRLYCYLPTLVSLPSPMFLQVDGQTKADREKLHDPELNAWNRHLLSTIPQILIDATLTLKNNPGTANRLLDYIPSDCGDQQLRPQFEHLIDLLEEEKWVLTFSSGKELWVTPEEAIIPSRFILSLIIEEPAFKTRAEKVLNKKFVHPEWLAKKEWENKLKSYGVQKIDDEKFIQLIRAAPIPQRWLKNSENLISLYTTIQDLACIKNRDSRHNKYHYESLRKSLLHSAIFPLPKKGFGPLINPEKESKIFWISTRTARETGLEGCIDYTIVSTEYTYHPKSNKESNLSENNEFEQKQRRNQATRELLSALDVPELNDENILLDLQIPYLVNTPCTKTEKKTRYKVLDAIFQKFRGKRKKDESDSDDFVKALKKLSDAKFPATSGEIHPLNFLLLPGVFQLYPEDRLFDCFFKAMYFPKKYSYPPQLTDGARVNKKDEERIRKWREEWHRFLVICGIRNNPIFELNRFYYSSAGEFREKNPIQFEKWTNEINNDYTSDNSVSEYTIQLDVITQLFLSNESNDVSKFPQPLYSAWKNHRDGFDLKEFGLYFIRVKIGDCYLKYTRFSPRGLFLKDEKWGGVQKDLIPLEDISGDITRAKNCIRIPSSDAKRLKITGKYLNFVRETTNLQDEHAYHIDYLDSLEIRRPDIQQVNELWKNGDLTNYSDILEIALEYASIGVDISALMILDKRTDKLRPVADFCMGLDAPEDTPLIEVQYGKIGKKIGEKLGLKDGNGPGIYSGIFHEIFSSRRVARKNLEILQNLLRQYQSWNIRDQRVINHEFEDAMKQSGRNGFVVVFNEEDTYKNVYDSKIWVVHLEVNEDDIFAMQESAQSIGFTIPEQIGEIVIEGEQSLDNEERVHLGAIFELYKKSLSKKARSKLQGKLRILGIVDIKSAAIFRVDNLHRSIGNGKIMIKTSLPHFDTRRNILFLQTETTTREIMGHLLEIADYGCFEDLMPRIGYFDDQWEIMKKSGTEEKSEESGGKRIEGTDSESVRKSISESMKRDAIPDNNGKPTSRWKNSPDPFQEIALRENVRNKINLNLSQGPETHKKRVRSRIKRSRQNTIPDGKKIVDPGSVNPESFFFEEYRQQCQVCGIQLKLQNGRYYSVTYHIHENQEGNTWWKDQPFNILCMCPNCHALTKNGGCDLRAVFDAAEEYEKGLLFPIEVPEYNGDYYPVEVEINGAKCSLVISPLHMMHFAALQGDEQVSDTSGETRKER